HNGQPGSGLKGHRERSGRLAITLVFRAPLNSVQGGYCGKQVPLDLNRRTTFIPHLIFKHWVRAAPVLPGRRRSTERASMKIAVLAGAVAAALTLSTAHATVRIRADAGGQIGPYLGKLVALRSSGG